MIVKNGFQSYLERMKMIQAIFGSLLLFRVYLAGTCFASRRFILAVDVTVDLIRRILPSRKLELFNVEATLIYENAKFDSGSPSYRETNKGLKVDCRS